MNSPQIIIWNLVSGHIFCRLKAPKPEGVKTFDPLEGDAAVGNLVFLPMRGTTRRAATLIACGPAGFIHFWNIYKGGKVMSHFIPVSLSLLCLDIHVFRRERSYLDYFIDCALKSRIRVNNQRSLMGC